MMKRFSRSFSLLTVASLASLASLAAPGCGLEGPAGGEDVGAAAQPVKSKTISPLVAEGLAVKHHIFAETISVDEVKGLHLGTLMAEDLDGEPAAYLVFTSPSPDVASPLAYGARLLKERGEGGDGDEEAPAFEPLPGETSAAVGAANTRLQVSAAGRGLGWLVDIARTVEAAGGEPHVKRFVAASSSAFLLEDDKGQRWDVRSAQVVPPEVFEEKSAQIREAKQAVLEGEIGKNLVKQWEVLETGYDPKEAPPVNEARAPEEFAGKDGHLDLERVASELDLSLIVREQKLDETSVPKGDAGGDGAKPGVSPQSRWQYVDACYSWWFFGWHSNCRTAERGTFWNPYAGQAHRAIQHRWFKVNRCIWAGSGAAEGAYEGCGPAAFTSLVWRERKRGLSFAGIPPFRYDPQNTYDQWGYGADNAWGPDFQSVMGSQVPGYMGSCDTGGSGTLTLPWDFINGGNRWLSDHGSGLRMGYRYTVFGANSFDASAKAGVLRNRLGYEQGPVVGAFDVGFLVAHYAPVNQYLIINPFPGHYWETTQVYVEGLDQGQSMGVWYSMHDPFALIAGLFWLQ